MNRILGGVNPARGLPSNWDVKGTTPTSAICASQPLISSWQRDSALFDFSQIFFFLAFFFCFFKLLTNEPATSIWKYAAAIFILRFGQTRLVWPMMDIVGMPLPVNETSLTAEARSC